MKLFNIDKQTIGDIKQGLDNLSNWLLDIETIIGGSDSKLSVDAKGTITLSSKTIINGNLGIGVSNVPDDLSIQTELPVKFQGKRFEVNNKIPTIGLYNKGDIVWTDDPKPNGNVGWICIRTGSPGEWRPFGNIGG
tara:strand:- start:2377 stop:2784 length:408 start_codon:yes stop_codon:yes gene_type:complete